MDVKDLKQIQEIFHEEAKTLATKDDLKDLATKEDVKSAVSQGLMAFWEHNLQPTFDGLDERLTIVERKLD